MPVFRALAGVPVFDSVSLAQDRQEKLQVCSAETRTGGSHTISIQHPREGTTKQPSLKR